MEHIQQVQIILFVSDQHASREFYEKLLRAKASLHVPGMTEFILSSKLKLGLMPNKGIASLLADSIPHPDTGFGIPRCELYLTVIDARAEFRHAVACGATAISAVCDRDWGDRVGYVADAEGHLIAFAQRISNR